MLATFRISALALVSAVLLTSVGCTSKYQSYDDTNPIAIPSNSAYQTDPLINNSEKIKAEAQNIRGIVHFAFDSNVLDAEAEAILNEQIAFLAAHPDATVLVAGHTDERGSSEYNHALGERRAQAVRAYLASQGINHARVETISYGEDQPVEAGHDEASYAKNRRAELSY